MSSEEREISVNVFMKFIYLNIFIRGSTHKGRSEVGGSHFANYMQMWFNVSFSLEPLAEFFFFFSSVNCFSFAD